METFVVRAITSIRHLSKQNQHRQWVNNIVKRYPEYARILRDLPSLKTISANEFLDQSMRVIESREYLLEFSKHHPFRKWRFTVTIFKRKAMEILCLRITKGLGKDKVLVGMGDWKGDTAAILKGQTRAPIVTLKKTLLHYATVVRLWEYGTSKMCHACKSPCEHAKLQTQPSKKAIKRFKEQKEKQKFVSASKTNQHLLLAPVVKITSTYKILCCTNNKCRIRYKHRDRNSSLNLRTCLFNIC